MPIETRGSLHECLGDNLNVLREAPPTSDDRVISGSLPCIRCGYDLDKRPLSSPCPECGNPAALTLDSLWLEDPAYILRLRRGARAMMWAALIGPAVYMGSVAAAYFLRTFTGFDEALAAIAMFVASLGPLIAWRGVTLLTTPRPWRMRPGARPDRGAAEPRVARVLGGVYAVFFAATMLLVWLDAARAIVIGDRVSLVLAIVAGEVWSVRNYVVLGQVRAVARDALMPGIAGAVLGLRCWVVVNAVAGGLLSLLLLDQSRSSWIFFRSASFFVYGSIILWAFVWPVLLARFDRGLKTIIRQFGSQVPPAIVEPEERANRA
jgi:hypothetical protein